MTLIVVKKPKMTIVKTVALAHLELLVEQIIMDHALYCLFCITLCRTLSENGGKPKKSVLKKSEDHVYIHSAGVTYHHHHQRTKIT